MSFLGGRRLFKPFSTLLRTSDSKITGSHPFLTHSSLTCFTYDLTVPGELMDFFKNSATAKKQSVKMCCDGGGDRQIDRV